MIGLVLVEWAGYLAIILTLSQFWFLSGSSNAARRAGFSTGILAALCWMFYSYAYSATAMFVMNVILIGFFIRGYWKNM